MVEVSCAKEWMQRGEKMSKKDFIQYTVEREFLDRLSTKELVGRIVRSHLKKHVKQQQSFEKMERN